MHLLRDWRKLSRYEQCLLCLFFLTLPLVNPWVRGDGVGYYAYGRALLIEGRLDFTQDWLRANPTFRMGRVSAEDQIGAAEYTTTGHLNNHFTIGPAILWFPFLVAAHVGVLASHALGSHVASDGFSWPYTTAMALGTATYGFLGLWLSFQLAKNVVPETWAFLATLGIWLASSLPVYLYFNPSWSHAHSAFCVALFVWYWHRTQGNRSYLQWAALGAVGGLMVDVYYPNAIVMLLPAIESLRGYATNLRDIRDDAVSAGKLAGANLVFLAVLSAVVLPTFVTRWIVYGDPFSTGYVGLGQWNWGSPVLGRVLLSADHGLFSWTPILALACAGLVFLWRRDRWLGGNLLAVALVFYYFIASYPDWDGISSFGNRFFVSLTCIFVLGLAVLFDELARAWQERRAAIMAASATAALILWNLGLVFQWGTHLIPARGAISWREAAYNQVAVVPAKAAQTVNTYLTRRSQLMRRIEGQDEKQLRSTQPQNEGTE
jgi:hypothetical protein